MGLIGATPTGRKFGTVQDAREGMNARAVLGRARPSGNSVPPEMRVQLSDGTAAGPDEIATSCLASDTHARNPGRARDRPDNIAISLLCFKRPCRVAFACQLRPAPTRPAAMPPLCPSLAFPRRFCMPAPPPPLRQPRRCGPRWKK